MFRVYEVQGFGAWGLRSGVEGVGFEAQDSGLPGGYTSQSLLATEGNTPYIIAQSEPHCKDILFGTKNVSLNPNHKTTWTLQCSYLFWICCGLLVRILVRTCPKRVIQ